MNNRYIKNLSFCTVKLTCFLAQSFRHKVLDSTRLFFEKGNDTQAFLARNSMRRPSWETSLQYRLYSSVMLVVCGNIWFLDSFNVLFGTAPTRVNHRFPYLRNFTLCHDGTCLFSTNQVTFGTKVTPTIWSLWRSMKTFWNRKGWPFPLFFWGSLCILPRYDLKALILLEEEVKNSNTMYVFCTLNGKTDKELKVPIWQHYPRKHHARCKQIMRAEKIFPCVRILTLITPYPSPHISGYIRIRNPTNN